MISIIIPVYNTEQGLPRCLDSVLASTCGDFEILLVNDGSTDKSPEICREYAGRDTRIRFMEQENKGVSAARNLALDACRGEWVVFVDSDDYISRDFLKTVAKKASGDLLIFDFIKPGEKEAGRRKKSMLFDGPEKKVVLLEGILGFRQLRKDGNTDLRSVCGKAYRKSVLDRYSIRFDRDVLVAEDALFNTEFILKAGSCRYIPLPVYRYTVRMGSKTHSMVSGLPESYYIYQRKQKKLLTDSNVFSKVENQYYACVLTVLAYLLINDVFSPCSTRTAGESLRLCREIGEDEIFREALKRNYRTGILPRRILLGFFHLKCYGITKYLCRLCHFCIERMDRRQEKNG